jgi:predicted protein tyrosine phosphatase
MNLLFICSRNQWRSPTAEALFRDNLEHSARSAGTSSSAKVRVSEKQLQWADRILVMEYKHKKVLLQRFPGFSFRAKIEVLDIPDDYQFMDDQLIEILKSKLEGLL